MSQENKTEPTLEKQKPQQSTAKKSIVAMVAVFALVFGAWMSIKSLDQHEKQREAESELQAAKQAAEADIASRSKPAKAVGAGDDLSFLLDIELQNLQGEPKAISSQLAKVTLVNFWATWCAPCREEMPVFNAIHQKHQDKGFGVLGLTIDALAGTTAFVDQLGIVYPILMAEHEGWDLLTKTGNPKNLMPYSFLIDQDGKVLETKLGPLHEEELEAWVEKYL